MYCFKCRGAGIITGIISAGLYFDFAAVETGIICGQSNVTLFRQPRNVSKFTQWILKCQLFEVHCPEHVTMNFRNPQDDLFFNVSSTSHIISKHFFIGIIALIFLAYQEYSPNLINKRIKSGTLKTKENKKENPPRKATNYFFKVIKLGPTKRFFSLFLIILNSFTEP